MNELTQRGIAALRKGDRMGARQYLGTALKQDPGDIQAWLWLSGAVDRDEERIDCLRQILKLDPNNVVAARGLAQMVERSAGPDDQSAPPQELEEDSVPGVSPEEESAYLQALDRVAPVSVPTPEPVERPTPTASFSTEPQEVAAVTYRTAPTTRRSKPAQSSSPGQTVFRARPSLVPAFLFFWVMVITLVGLNSVLPEEPSVVFPIIAALAAVLFLVIAYVTIRLYTTRYELTTQHLSLPFQGKQVDVLLSDILSLEPHQSGFQKALGVGDVLIDAGLHGVLHSMRIHNLPKFRQRSEQLINAVRIQQNG
jgi:hypothetical protein